MGNVGQKTFALGAAHAWLRMKCAVGAVARVFGSFFKKNNSPARRSGALAWEMDMGVGIGSIHGSIAVRGSLFAAGLGVAVALPAAAATLTTLYTFPASPQPTYPTGLIYQDGMLYGAYFTGFGGCAAQAGGAVFQFDLATGTETQLYNFPPGTNGEQPNSTPLLHNGHLYGTTACGGAGNVGAIYDVDLTTHKKKTIYSFPSGGPDGALPNGGLIYVNGSLYGVTAQGGLNGTGTVFQLDLSTGGESVLYSFASGGTDGAAPIGSLLYGNGLLYGATEYGGAGSNYGTIFSVEPGTGHETVLYRFLGGSDGVSPNGDLIFANSMLYGTTLTGGNLKHTRPKHACCGTVFTINPSTGAERVLTQFGHNAPLGYQPGGPIALRNGLIYGANQRPYGSVFAVNAATGHAKALYTFSTSSPSAVPLGGVIYHRGTMYGVTEGYEDGSPRATIYQLTP